MALKHNLVLEKRHAILVVQWNLLINHKTGPDPLLSGLIVLILMLGDVGGALLTGFQIISVLILIFNYFN